MAKTQIVMTDAGWEASILEGARYKSLGGLILWVLSETTREDEMLTSAELIRRVQGYKSTWSAKAIGRALGRLEKRGWVKVNPSDSYGYFIGRRGS